MNQNYLIKHWLTTLVLASFLRPLYEFILKPIPGQIVGLLEIYLITLIFSFLFSLPTLIIYFLTFKQLIKQNANPILTKFILISVTVIGINITVLLIGGSLSLTLIFAFSCAGIITGCIFKIKAKSDTEKLSTNM
jgi:hypothetical protein